MTDYKQEKRTERHTLAVTPTEKRAIEFVALADEIEPSNLLRTHSLEAVLFRYERMREAIEQSGKGAATDAGRDVKAAA